MLSAEATYLFRHAAVRDVVYSLHLPSARAEMHRAALETLEHEFAGRTDEIASELAQHARLGREGVGGSEAARLAESEFQYLQQSVKRLHARAHWDRVIHAVEYALLTGCGTAEEQCNLLTEKLVALDALGRRREMLEPSAELTRLGRDSDLLRFELQGLDFAALTRINLGELAAAEELLNHEVARADEKGLAESRAKARMNRAMLATARGDSAACEALLLEALALIGDSKAPMRWPIRGNLANLYGGTGRYDEAIQVFCELLEEYEAEKTADFGWHFLGTAQSNLACQYLRKGDLEKAEIEFMRAIKTSEETGAGRTIAFALANLAEADLLRGNFERAEQSLLRATDVFREYGLPLYHAAYQCTLAQLQLLLGHELQAQELVEDARAEFVAVGGEAFVAEYCGIVRLRVAASRAASFPVQGRKTSRLRASQPSGSWLPVMRELAAQIRQSRDARGARAGAPLEAAARDAADLVAEFELALNERRPAMVFRGHLPSRMRPDLRQSLVKRMAPAEAEMLQRLQPVLWEALNAA